MRRFPILILAALTASLAWGLLSGPLEIGLAEAWQVAALKLAGGLPSDGRMSLVAVVLFDVRLPRILAAALVGAALSTSGATFQSVLANPLVSPGVLGVLAGASCGAAAGILWGGSWAMVQSLAFAGGLIAVGLGLALAQGASGDRVLALVLGGIVSSALFTAVLSLLKTVADPYAQLPAIVFWLMGSLANVKGAALSLSAAPLLGAILGMVLLGRSLDVLSMGDEEARALGLPAGRLRLLAIALATLAGALSVALAGVVGWVGLIIPHLARLLLGPSNRLVMPASAVLGAAFLVAVDTGARSLFASELPLGIATALMGVPFMAMLMRKRRQG